MGMTNTQVRSYLASMLDIDIASGDGATLLLAAMNMGGNRVWREKPWYGREVSTDLFMVAPYTTGTVSITQADTALTGVGTTWTTAMTGRKIAVGGIGQPWYRFTRTGNTTGTIPTGGYAEETASASTYAIFDDELDLPTTAETIRGVWLYSPLYDGQLFQMTQTAMDNHLVTARNGTIYAWAPTLSTTAGTRRIRVLPIPNAIGRVRVEYVSAWTDVAADGGTSQLGANRERAWILASALEAQRGADVKKVTSDDEVLAAIETAWTKEQAVSPQVARRTPIGHGMGWGRTVGHMRENWS